MICAALHCDVTNAAAVVSRAKRPSVAAQRASTQRVATAQQEQIAENTKETETKAFEPEIHVENKSSQFSATLTDTIDNENSADTELAKKIREQRAALDARDATAATSQAQEHALSNGKNLCDQNLRACMQEKCGKDFSKCANDTDTTWGSKMDNCRLKIECTGEEYRLFTTEIKADRDANKQLSLYNSIVGCGNDYNNCIIAECGQKFTKCLGKTAGDAAVAKCKQIADSCQEQDNGLAARAMGAFGTLRQDAEKTITRDEKRLYELRDKMAETCKTLGAMFDERTLDCVYTINFYAGDQGTLFASKKAYAGSSFSCTPDWFGIDVTTFKENAYRLTREQTSASSAMLGAGLGIGVGALTSGAIDRAIDRSKAERELGEKLCTTTKGTWNKTTNLCKCTDGYKFNDETGCTLDEKADKNDISSATTTTDQTEQPPTSNSPAPEKTKDIEVISLATVAESYKTQGFYKHPWFRTPEECNDADGRWVHEANECYCKEKWQDDKCIEST